MSLSRGAVWFASLPEIGLKPVAVVSPNFINRALANVIVARITSVQRPRTLPTFVVLDPDEVPGLPDESIVICHDLFTIPKTLLDRHLGDLSTHRLLQVDTALGVALGL
jgi:mRNA interferase MazF